MSRSSRKLDHIEHALTTGQAGTHGFEDVSFIPNSLPNISYVNLSMQTFLGSLKLSSPIFINAMTGGVAEAEDINGKLALIAREKGLAMAVGSQMAALRDPSLTKTYRIVRQVNPHGIVIANLGAECTLELAERAIAMIEADALQIHLNVMQELLMPEGDRTFEGHLESIAHIADRLSVPVIVKEVGFGMARTSIRQLVEVGVAAVDIGGSGGTNFAKIENRRNPEAYDMFDTWGLSTAQSLLEAGEINLKGTSLIASGGLRHGLDVAKSIALGASAVGMAGVFLRMVKTMAMQACLDRVDRLHHELKIAMVALGARTLSELGSASIVIGGDTARWAEQRAIDLRRYALRKEEM
ncbi:UNVERIFIED_CONTAM: isopentenyl-diphosphate delta-isomerase [Brevibacillus sp. OAP136]